MKNIGRKGLAALVLTLALSPAALADDGVMHTDVAPPPPPPPAALADDGVMHTGATDTLTQVALSLIETLTRL